MNFVKHLCRALVSVSKRVRRSSSRRRRTRRRRWRMTRRSGESLESAGALCRVPAPSRLSQRSKKGLRSADCWWNNSLTFTRSLRSPKTLVAKFCSATKEGSWSESVLNNLRNLNNGERALTFESRTWGKSSHGGTSAVASRPGPSRCGGCIWYLGTCIWQTEVCVCFVRVIGICECVFGPCFGNICTCIGAATKKASETKPDASWWHEYVKEKFLCLSKSQKTCSREFEKLMNLLFSEAPEELYRVMVRSRVFKTLELSSDHHLHSCCI